MDNVRLEGRSDVMGQWPAMCPLPAVHEAAAFLRHDTDRQLSVSTVKHRSCPKWHTIPYVVHYF